LKLFLSDTWIIMNKILKIVFFNIFVKNLILALLILGVVVFFALRWLGDYTQHGESVEIPDVKGLTEEKAIPIFANLDLKCVVSDSAFFKDFPKGAIIETIPATGSKVKRGRTVFLRINSLESLMIPLPEVKDMSQRQARAILRSQGFEKVDIRLVAGQFRDLVTGVESRGKKLEAGEKIAPNTPIELLVSSGNGELDIETLISEGEIDTAESEGENWY